MRDDNSFIYSIRDVSTLDKKAEMNSILGGYLSNDRWDMLDPFFEQFRSQNFDTTRRSRFIDFSAWSFNRHLQIELKFYLAKNLLDNNFSVTTAQTTLHRTKQIREYLKNEHPNIESLMEIDLEKTVIKLRTYLHQKGFKSGTKHKHDFEAVYDIRRIYDYLYRFYDTRDEYDKDQWDVRKIPGLTVNYSSAHFTISFEKIPAPFKDMVKRYLRTRLKTKAFGTVVGDSNYIRSFLVYLHQRFPAWKGLTELSRVHIENYLDYLATNKADTTEDLLSPVIRLDRLPAA